MYPFKAHFPCLCKASTANEIADIVLYGLLKSLPGLSEHIPSRQQWVKRRLSFRIAQGAIRGLEKIAEPNDIMYRCSAYGGLPHMYLRMGTIVKVACEKAVSQELAIIKSDVTAVKTSMHRLKSVAGSPSYDLGSLHFTSCLMHALMVQKTLPMMFKPSNIQGPRQ